MEDFSLSGTSNPTVTTRRARLMNNMSVSPELTTRTPMCSSWVELKSAKGWILRMNKWHRAIYTWLASVSSRVVTAQKQLTVTFTQNKKSPSVFPRCQRVVTSTAWNKLTFLPLSVAPMQPFHTYFPPPPATLYGSVFLGLRGQLDWRRSSSRWLQASGGRGLRGVSAPPVAIVCHYGFL